MRLYYIANARMPSEKAHGIQIAKMCEAMVERGVDLTLLLPSRKTTTQSIKEFYGLRKELKTVFLPSFDWYDGGRILYALSTISFVVSYALYVLLHRRQIDVLYTVDLDHFSYAVFPFLGLRYFCEMHGGKPNTLIHRMLFKNASGIIPTNSITKHELKDSFTISEEKFLVEPNGVDFTKFAPISKQEARHKLSLPQDVKLALYVGRFFDWKGLEILSEAQKFLPPDITLGVVGGDALQFARVTKSDTANMVFYGDRPYTEMPLWASAADALVVLGTKRDTQSYRYTSPMKLFEYMAIQRPIIASKTPALQAILDERECYFYEPDQAENLASKIEEAILSPDESKTQSAFEKVGHYTWSKRAERVVAFVRKNGGTT